MARLGPWSSQRRTGAGRFRKPNLEQDFGLRVAVCPACNGINPYARRADCMVGGLIDPLKFNQWDRPAACGHCGAALPPEEA